MKYKFPFGLMRLRKGKSTSDIERMFASRAMPIVQKKYDGHLVQIEKRSGKVRVASRRGKDLTSRLKPIIGKLSSQLKRPGVYLGELIVQRGSTHKLYDVQSIVSSKPEKANEFVRSHNVRFALFDKIYDGTSSMATAPYRDRYSELRSSVKGEGPAFVVKNYKWDNLDKAMASSLKEGGEGVVLKDPDGAYKLTEADSTERKGSQWKLKAPGVKDQSDDFLLVDYRKGKEKLIFDAAQYDNGELYIVGKLSGLDKQTEKSVAKKIDRGENVVVEASFQERLPSGKYRHLAWVRLRPDKPQKSVTMARKNPDAREIQEMFDALGEEEKDLLLQKQDLTRDELIEFLDQAQDSEIRLESYSKDDVEDFEPTDLEEQTFSERVEQSEYEREFRRRAENLDSFEVPDEKKTKKKAPSMYVPLAPLLSREEMREQSRLREGVVIEDVGGMCFPRVVENEVQRVYEVRLDDDPGLTMLAKIAETDDGFRLSVYKQTKVPLTYQYFNKRTLRKMLKRAPLAMEVFGCERSYIDRYREIPEEDLEYRLYEWAVWYASFRLFPWMVWTDNFDIPDSDVDRCPVTQGPFALQSKSPNSRSHIVGPDASLSFMAPGRRTTDELFRTNISALAYVRKRAADMGTGNNVVAPAPVRTEDEDIITRLMAAAGQTYRNASRYFGSLLEAAEFRKIWNPDYYTNIITGVESPYGIDPVFESGYEMISGRQTGDIYGRYYWGGAADLTRYETLETRDVEELDEGTSPSDLRTRLMIMEQDQEDPEGSDDDADDELLAMQKIMQGTSMLGIDIMGDISDRAKKITEASVKNKKDAVKKVVEEEDAVLYSSMPGISYDIEDIEGGSISVPVYGKSIAWKRESYYVRTQRRFPSTSNVNAPVDGYPYFTGVSSFGPSTLLDMGYRQRVIDYGKSTGREANRLYYVEFNVPGYDLLQADYTEYGDSVEDLLISLKSQARDISKRMQSLGRARRFNPDGSRVESRDFRYVDNVLLRSLEIGRSAWNGNITDRDGNVVTLRKALKSEIDQKSVLGNEGEGWYQFLKPETLFGQNPETSAPESVDSREGDIFYLSGERGEKGSAFVEFLRFTDEGRDQVVVPEVQVRDVLTSPQGGVGDSLKRLWPPRDTRRRAFWFYVPPTPYYVEYIADDTDFFKKNDIYEFVWAKLTPEGETVKDIQYVKTLPEDDQQWWVLLRNISTDEAIQYPLDYALEDFLPFVPGDITEDDYEVQWPERLMKNVYVDPSSGSPFSVSEESYEAAYENTRGNEEYDALKKKNPCIGMHFHADDFEKILSAVERRQNPGFVKRMVDKHKKLGDE